MTIKLRQIYNSLINYSPTIFSENSENQILFETKLLTDNIGTIEKNVLYVGKASLFNKKLGEISKGNFLIEKDEEIKDDFIGKDLNIIVIPPVQDLNLLFYEVKNLFVKDFIILDSSAILLDALIKNRGIKYIINIGSKILDNPVILIDTGYKILAHSDMEMITEPFWIRNINMGYCSYEFISEVRKIKAVQKSPNSNEPFQVICSGSPIRKLVSKVLINSNVVSYVIALECNEKFNDNTYRIVKLLSNVVSEELKKNDVYRNLKGIMYENLIVDLIEGNVKDNKTLDERMKSAQCNFGHNLQLLIMDISNYNSTNNPANFLKQSLDNILPNHKSLFYKNNILILLDFKDDSSLSNKTKESLKNFIKENNIILFVSDVFENILEISHFYRQGIDTLKLIYDLDLKGNVFFYEDLKFYHLLNKTGLDKDLLNFCNNGLFKIIQYDEDNNTEYYKTLKTYIEEDRNAVQSANKLFIHRNTMNYRLDKIRKIGNLNLDSGEEIFKITMSIKILEYLLSAENLKLPILYKY